MVRNTRTEDIMEEAKPLSPIESQAEAESLRLAAIGTAASLGWTPGVQSSDTLSKRCHELLNTFESTFDKVEEAFAQVPESEDLLWLRDNAQQLKSAARAVSGELTSLDRIPHVRRNEETLPRVLAMAEAFYIATGNTFSEDKFTTFSIAFEETTALEFHEIGALVPSIKLILLEQIASRGHRIVSDPTDQSAERVVPFIRTFREITQTSWTDVLELLIPFDKILSEDPAGAYSRMDLESRNVYRERVARIARRSDRTEMEVAEEALALAHQAQRRNYSDPRIALRESHVGYYLVSDGSSLLCRRVACHPTFGERFRDLLRHHPDEYLLFGIAILTFTIITTAILLLTTPATSPMLVLLSVVILLLPASQAAVQIMNYLTTNLLPAEGLPKLDFSEAIPDDCVTLVAIPTLLLNEKQVHGLIENLEVRYLGNHDCNLHFAIVSDLPDSDHPAQEENALVELCSKLITDLNERYSSQNAGTFFHLHRHRVYNPRERGWMGWERKRGKLLDLNQLISGQYDSFPVKIGKLSILPDVRYVITLDSDTELPREAAQQMIGAIAHPLNQAIVDPAKNIVVAGYGILQPRVGVSVQSTARSRLAAIFAGETGMDPYTRAISDVYQDLYGEGTFTGKGIYEVETMSKVLLGRFPRNALLSHDLIEGAYARAGLTTDIIVIEDYPSHYSAYNRRKHRWLRGDWQIVEWLTDTVPNESGARVPNPISLLSRWKILDNLRRSLTEPATFVLLLFAWLVMDHPVFWTLATVCILFVPALFEFIFAVARVIIARQFGIIRGALGSLFASNFTVLLTLALLLHQTMLSIDAVVRTVVRRLFTHQRLLEWETAAEAELGARKTPVDRYIDWMPYLSTGLGVIIWFVHRRSLLPAIPILVLWACSKLMALWLNASPLESGLEMTRKDFHFLRNCGLHIWRYFAEFSTAEHNWLVPDNIQDEPIKVAAAISPTNVGLLLNARQVAVEFGYLTVPEFADLTQKTLDTVAHMRKYRGHLLNWYDTRKLDAKPPFFISSVDSGNLVASLWTLRQGSLDRSRHPLYTRRLAEGILDFLRALADMRALPKRDLARLESELESENWLAYVLTFPDDILKAPESKTESSDTKWFREQLQSRIQTVRDLVRSFTPWKLPEFGPLREKFADAIPGDDVLLQILPERITALQARLEDMRAALNGNGSVAENLRAMLAAAKQNGVDLIKALQHIADQSRDFAKAMEFKFMLDQKRLQLSVGFDAGTEELAPYYYDLLATEPRTAVFVAIAKEEIEQDCWFRLGRPFTRDHGRSVLLSWTGTMFEYLMPTIWIKNYPNTLLDRAILAAVRSQQEFGSSQGVPWGISESACSKRNEVGDYHYEAFGVPALALKKSTSDRLVISPYSTLLALNVDPEGSLSNLRRMESLGWFGSYGFFEAADFTGSRRRFRRTQFEIVHSWMVHHQGMGFLSLANFLCDNVVQRWFHTDRRVQATELLLQERPVSQAA